MKNNMEIRQNKADGTDMKFYKHLYVGEGIKHPNKVKWKLRRNAGQFQIYVIALAAGKDQLEIYHCAFLLELVVEITKEAIERDGYPDLKKYLFPESD